MADRTTADFSHHAGVMAGQLALMGSGTVTQATSITTGVTVNASCGTIVTVSQTIAAAAEASFTVTNSFVEANDVVIVNVKSTSSAGGPFIAYVSAVAAGSFQITLTNPHAANAGDNTITLSFAVIKVSA